MIVQQILAGITIAPIARPLAAVLAFFYSLIPNYVVAIGLLTTAMMILLTPLTIKQTRSMLVMQKLQPEMKKLQEQHKNDRQALNEAVMALYKEHNASPLGGCLPMLLPFPLFIALLKVLEGLSRIEHIKGKVVPAGYPADCKVGGSCAVPNYLTHNTKMYQDIVAAGGKLNSFGVDVAKTASNAGGGFVHSLPYFVLLVIMTGTQFYQQYQLTSKNPAIKNQPGQAMMMKFIPIFFGLISLRFPAGVVLYWTVSNIIRIGQQWALYRYDPKVKALVIKDVKEVEAKTREIDAKEAKAKTSLRGMFANASDTAADRRNRAGKNGATPGSKRPGDKAAAPNRNGRPQPGKASATTPGGTKAQPPGAAPGKRSGPQKGAPPRGAPGQKSAVAAQKGTAVQKATAAKGTVRKAGAVKPGAGTGTAKPGAGATKPGAGAAKPAATAGAGAGAGGTGTGASKAGPAKAAAPKAGASNASVKPAASKATATARPGNGVTAKPAATLAGAKPAAAPTNGSPATPAGATPAGTASAQSVEPIAPAAIDRAPSEPSAANGAPAQASPRNGDAVEAVADKPNEVNDAATDGPAVTSVATPAGNGGGAAGFDEGLDAAVADKDGSGPAVPAGGRAGNGTPSKGRTGGGSARNVSSRRRRGR